MGQLIDATDSDIFDVLAYVRFSLDPKTRHARADDARRDGLEGYELDMRDFLRHVLEVYEKYGVTELGYDKLSNLLTVRYGSVGDARRRLGDVATIRKAFSKVQKHIYAE